VDNRQVVVSALEAKATHRERARSLEEFAPSE